MDGRDYDPNMFGFMPPKPGACPVCAYNHGPNEPHFPGSAYYIMRFYRRHNRRPTWKDAMTHCPPEVQKQWTDELIERGILPKPKEEAMTDG